MGTTRRLCAEEVFDARAFAATDIRGVGGNLPDTSGAGPFASETRRPYRGGQRRAAEGLGEPRDLCSSDEGHGDGYRRAAANRFVFSLLGGHREILGPGAAVAR